jgi:hypothetical protein
MLTAVTGCLRRCMFTTIFYNEKINYSKHVNGRDRVLEEVHVFYSFVINNNITITVLL